MLGGELGVGVAEHYSGGADQLQSRVDPGAEADIPARDHVGDTAMLDAAGGQQVVVVHDDHSIIWLEPGNVEAGDTEGNIDHG